MKKYLCLAVISVLFLNGCSYMQNLWPFGDEISEKETIQDEGSYLAVNPYLWQASLDKLAFMPLASSDAKGGVIVTEWKKFASNEQLKVVVNIYSQKLQANSLKVVVYKKVLKGNSWSDAASDEKLALETENAILTQARELYHRDVMTR